MTAQDRFTFQIKDRMLAEVSSVLHTQVYDNGVMQQTFLSVEQLLALNGEFTEHTKNNGWYRELGEVKVPRIHIVPTKHNTAMNLPGAPVQEFLNWSEHCTCFKK